MITVKTVGSQEGQVVLSIVYTDMGNMTRTVNESFNLANLLGMTLNEVKDRIKKRIAQERLQIAEAQIADKLKPLIDVDLEAVPP